MFQCAFIFGRLSVFGVDNFLFKLFYARSVFYGAVREGWVCLYYPMSVLLAGYANRWVV